MINLTILSNLIFDNITNETWPEKPEINDTKNDTTPGKDKGSAIDMVVIGVIIVIIIAIVILMVFLFIKRKKPKDKEIINEPQKDQLELVSQEPTQESEPPPVAPEQVKLEQQPEISETTVTPPEKEIESINAELSSQEDLKPETEQIQSQKQIPQQQIQKPIMEPQQIQIAQPVHYVKSVPTQVVTQPQPQVSETTETSPVAITQQVIQPTTVQESVITSETKLESQVPKPDIQLETQENNQ